MTQHYDTIVIGGGIAGLAAAHRLSGRNVLVLEAADRPGGRIHSQPAGDYWLNFGAHMFGGTGSLVGDLVTELGLDARPIKGVLLGVAHKQSRLLGGRLETIPLQLKLSLRERLSFIRMGIALRLGSERIVPVLRGRAGESADATRTRVLGYRNEQTLAQALGVLQPEIARFLEAFTERTGGSPSEMAAGYALRSFTNVWSKHSPGHNLHGGSAGLPQALASRLGDRLQLGAQVSAVQAGGDIVTVDYIQNGVPHRVTANAAIVATPAYVTGRIVRDLPVATLDALNAIRYGAFLTMAIRTSETGPMPWDGNYAIATPARSFSVLFNMATSLRTGSRKPGGSIMLFRGARGASALMEKTDAQIEAQFLTDLYEEFPEARGIVTKAVIQRWPAGAPYSWPGRGALQPALTAPLGRVFLAGDYLEFPNMDAAIATGYEAADRAGRVAPGMNPQP